MTQLISVQDIQDESERPFYESEKDDDKSDDGSVEVEAKPKPKPFVMDSDHRLLLRQAKPLLNSRNAAVSREYNTTPKVSLTVTRVRCVLGIKK